MKSGRIGKNTVLIILCLLLVFAQTSAMAATRVTSVVLNRTSYSLYNTTLAKIPHSFQLKATVYPTNATNRTLKWTSTKTSVATVSSTGLVTAKGSGYATIKAMATDGSGCYATCVFAIKSMTYSVLVSYMITPESDKIYNALKSSFSSRSTGLSKLLTARGAITNLRDTCSKFSKLTSQSSRLSTMYTYCNNAYIRLSNNSNPQDSTLLSYIKSIMNSLKTFKTYCSSL
ncbi:MAG TPA: Ig-like domain-containing protein [Candidatus Limiplasma sp.]|nr:Ig-like domain-containing protein [Candidatus Limiplasma sp.]